MTNSINKKKILLTTAISVIAVVSVIILLTINSFTVNAEVNSNLSSLMKTIEQMQKSKSELSYSSNPYDYIKNNENYDNIIKVGIKALPDLVDKLKNSPNNGLEEFIVAIAIQEISQIDLNKGDASCSNAKEYLSEYHRLLRNVKDQAAYIVESKEMTFEEKQAEFDKLGVYADPYILQLQKSTVGTTSKSNFSLKSSANEEDIKIIQDLIDNSYNNWIALNPLVFEIMDTPKRGVHNFGFLKSLANAGLYSFVLENNTCSHIISISV